MSAMASQITGVDCLLNRLFRRRLKKTSKLRVTGLCGFPQKGPVMWKMFPSDDVIMEKKDTMGPVYHFCLKTPTVFSHKMD